MTDQFILWAQALDNSSPDHFTVHGNDLGNSDTVQRQEAVSKVSAVIKKGARLFERDGVMLTADASHFVIEIPSVQSDLAGRIAPIVCYGPNGVVATGGHGIMAVAALTAFARRIGRTLQPEQLKLVDVSFDALKKKSKVGRMVRTAGLSGLALALLVLVYWLRQRGW
ncbi:hypothetical protein [Pseudoxanthomonas indica]|uniref:Uncharacterized protein n=1 Tax=Pseudoxanthomonas indica TaxID=428993 RepID=A0A1T5LEL3_9GAMM|nr:hypothetical protein [Pseudoxanthomonas indica]GGD33677.1 hypothetical protein GCM10007235_01960 [Pseudoxanthomonas indica]SKC73828.1 hypothetical protein SAMN06296058_2322 [Pseudoxanthomonas indica]